MFVKQSFHLNSYISVCFLVDSPIKYSGPQYSFKLKRERELSYETPADFGVVLEPQLLKCC